MAKTSLAIFWLRANNKRIREQIIAYFFTPNMAWSFARQNVPGSCYWNSGRGWRRGWTKTSLFRQNNSFYVWDMWLQIARWFGKAHSGHLWYKASYKYVLEFVDTLGPYTSLETSTINDNRHLTIKSRFWYFNEKKLWCINIWLSKNQSHEKA